MSQPHREQKLILNGKEKKLCKEQKKKFLVGIGVSVSSEEIIIKSFCVCCARSRVRGEGNAVVAASVSRAFL